MDNEGLNPEDEPTQAVALSPEFLAGGTEAGLEKLRARLLDLTNRNRLLNFRHSTASTLRVVDADLDTVFERLRNEEKLTFQPVPEPPASSKVTRGTDDVALPAKPAAADYAASLGIPISYDLEASRTAMDSVADLQVLHYVDGLETLTRKIGSAAKTAIEESGTNMLHLTLGFLEWYESEDSSQARLAPLLTVPVALERSGAKGKAFECTIEFSGEDFSTNLSLVEKMRRDFGIEIPTIEEEDTPARYFHRFEPILAQQTRWRIRRHITLALLSFGKLLMYRDLDKRFWPGIVKHSLVTELFEGHKSDIIRHAEEYPIDAEDLPHRVPELVVDADSSQHSALIDAMRGRNLVIEGPPGTGKSQTITNLIAGMLTAGKTVLFVSEKLAALEVVRRRLDNVGLGLFCLEFHSHKTRKDALLSDLDRRLKAQGSFRDPRDLDKHLSVAEEKKHVLTKHAGLMNRFVEPIQATVVDILWARDHAYQCLPFERQLVETVFFPSALQFGPIQVTHYEQFLSIYVQHLQALFRSGDSLEDQAWAWVGKELSFEEQVILRDLLLTFVNTVRDTESIAQVLTERAGIPIEMSVAGLTVVGGLLAALPEVSEPIDLGLLHSCRDSAVRSTLEVFCQEVTRASESRKALASVTISPDPTVLLQEECTIRLERAATQLQRSGHDQRTVQQLEELLLQSQSAERALLVADDAFVAVAKCLDCHFPFDKRSIEVVLNFILAIEEAPMNLLHLRVPQLEAANVAQILTSASKKAQDLTTRALELDQEFDLQGKAKLEGVIQLRAAASAAEQANIWQVWFGSEYRRAWQTHRRIARKTRRLSRQAVAKDLRSLSDYFDARARFEHEKSYKEAFGARFRGVSTRWSELENLVAWYVRVAALLPGSDSDSSALRERLLNGRFEDLNTIRTSLAEEGSYVAAVACLRTKLPGAGETLPATYSSSVSLRDLRERLGIANGELEESLGALRAADLRPDSIAADLGVILETVRNHKTTLARIDSLQHAREILGPLFSGAKTVLPSVQAAVRFAECVDRGALPRQVVDWLLSENHLARLDELQQSLKKMSVAATTLGTTRDAIRTVAGSRTWHSDPAQPLNTVAARASRSLEHREDLSQWLHFLRIQKESADKGIGQLTSLADTRQYGPECILPAFRFVFYNTWVHRLFREYPELSGFSGITQDQIRDQFADADRCAIRLQRERIAMVVDRRKIPAGQQSSSVAKLTDLALIIHEISKQKRHIPIRQLVRRAGRALQAMKPCFMMGPLSVAQYLDPGKLQFDLVVMDEASQLKPEDAIGAIARGAQIVVVGDPKQLPPTSFFERVALDDESSSGDDRTVVEEGESILDVASTLYQPVRRLRWHYRSRHHSLIAFSNREFYKGDLIVFPSAFRESAELGVKYHQVHGGTFEERRNAPEAAAVVDAVMEHMQRRPGESLGVVTVNFEQRELIEELLDQRLRSDPFAIAYQERMNSGPEPFFIKNLENVQGDERDVIFISATYGPDARGNQYQRFGPINGPNGHRRLNVLFTRAKKRTEVYSSLDADKIQVTGSSAWGLRAFKQYLTFARTGVLDTSTDNSSQATNDFERSVGAVLSENGYTVVPQVGVAGFFVDLGVIHPTKPGAFVLGVECDGASYHSGRSARDRDRLRQEILVNQGWKIHRIWSTDWFKSRNTEIKRLLRRIDEILAADPDHRREVERAQNVKSLCDQLTELRETEILLAFPDAPTEKCLLRQAVLDELVRKRPRTRADWFRAIPLDLRDGTDAKQVGQYLDRVLEIISSTFD